MRTLKLEAQSVPVQTSEVRDNYPHSIALSDGGRKLSYDELNRKADRFAGYLAQLGVVSGGTVAVCMERSFDWIVAALGIMRAGAAYVPLDAAWPDSRLRFAVHDSGSTVVVARATLLDRLRVDARGVDPCRDAQAIADAPAMQPNAIEPDSLAYVIYTSGSTGVPKGVEITHANLAHLVRWHRNAFNVTRRDRVSHLLGLGFDAAVLEIWPHLCAGATLCLADDAARSSPELIQQWMVRERVTVGIVPAILGARLIEMAWPATSALRLMITGGDVLHHGPAAHLPFEVVNNYGPTECTVVSTWALLKPEAEGAPPIGLPIAGASIYLLNEDGEQVPDGQTGEIYIGGSGVGRGYRNLPDLTERSFLPDPFAGEPGARMYRTGDRGVRRRDGNIEFRGRLDRQAKIRGYRVELDEIGSLLDQHPSVDFATAIVNVSHAGENQLVAYVLPKTDVEVPTALDLQKYLLRSLPDYMIPANFVRLHEIPLSLNGKIDLTMLPRPTAANLLKRIAGKALASPIAERLLAIVRELLERNTIALEDNFFLVGGHSLLGTQLLMRVRKEFGVGLSLRQLFETPTVEGLASSVELMLGREWLAGVWAELLGRDNIQLDDNFFSLGGKPELLVFVHLRIAAEFGRQISIDQLIENATLRQQSELTRGPWEAPPVQPPGVLALQPKGTRNRIYWIHYLGVSLAKVMEGDQPFFAVRLMAEDLASLSERPTLERIAACHVHKILSTQPHGPYTVGGFSLAGILAFEVAQQLQAAGHEVSLLIMLDPPSPSYSESRRQLTPKLSQPGYLLKRVARLGLKRSLSRARKHVFEPFAPLLETESPRTEFEIGQELIAIGSSVYQPKRYDGRVLLLLASERPPDSDVLPGWQALVPSGLHAQYLDGYHEELTEGLSAQRVVDAISSHLVSATELDPVFEFLPGWNAESQMT
jgi:amino acid adenylation domain-containing protein